MTEQEWLACTDPDQMLAHLLAQLGLGREEAPSRETFIIRTPEERKAAEALAVKTRDRKLRLFACACCRRIWDVLTDERSRKAIEASEDYADRLITQRQLTAACGAAQQVVRKVLNPFMSNTALEQAAQAAHDVAKSAQTIPSRAHLMTYMPGGIVNRVTVCADALTPPRPDERQQLAVLLRDIVGNPFRPVTFSSDVRSATVVSLAEAFYHDRAFDRMPVLADALEEAGCTDEAILAHCRGPGPHVRGCWVVDLVLGKE